MTAFGIGSILATGTSVASVLADISRKKAVGGRNLLATSFWISVASAICFAAMFVWRVVTVPGPLVHSTGPIFHNLNGGFGESWTPLARFGFCLLIDGVILAVAMLYYIRALQVADLSMAVPFLAFTPVLLIPTGYIFLHEIPNMRQMLGVVLVVCGSVAMNRSAFHHGLLGPIKAIFTERGSRYMLLVAVIYSVSNPVDKMIVLMSDPYTAAFGYGLILIVTFGAMLLFLRREWTPSNGLAPRWIAVAGLLYAATQLLQFMSHRYIDVVLTITIKRAGIILSVLAGWLIFREKHIEDRLVASFAMLCGAVMIYLPINEAGQITLTAVVLVALVFNLGSKAHMHAPKV